MVGATSAVEPSPAAPKFLDRFRTALLIRSFAPAVTEAYVGWVRSFIYFHRLRHPETMGEREIGACLTELAVARGEPLAR